MNKFKFYFILLISIVSIFSCSKSDDDYTPEPLRDYQTQYNSDINDIKEYLNSNFLDMDLTDPNFADKDVVISKIPEGGTQPSLMSYLNSPTLPSLKLKYVQKNGVNYELYYLVLREGSKNTTTNLGGLYPCNVDGVLTAYKGSYIYRTAATSTSPSLLITSTFEEVKYPNTILSLFETIAGWGEVFPEFKTGSYTVDSTNGKITYTDFGAGVMFLPSGLAYYNQSSAAIPSYSPLIFNFKLYDLQRLDQDNDGIPSYLEDKNGDRYVRILPVGTDNPDDTDKDEIPDFYDIDDDGDKYTTKTEITNPSTGLPYAFDIIPSCSGDTSDPQRLRKHLDSSCH